MSTPRIARALPADTITTLDEPIAVIARLLWLADHKTEDVQAWALATSPRHPRSPAGTLICWLADEPRQDWIATHDIRLPGEPHSGIRELAFKPEPPLKDGLRPGPVRPQIQSD